MHRDRTAELQSVIQELEEKIVKLEKNIKNYDTLTGFVERNKDIFNPTDQALQFKNREEQMNEEIHLMKLELQRGKETEEKLLNINGVHQHRLRSLGTK